MHHQKQNAKMSALAVTFVSSFTCPRKKLEKCSQMSSNVMMDPTLGFAQETFSGTKKSLDEWIASTKITAVCK